MIITTYNNTFTSMCNYVHPTAPAAATCLNVQTMELQLPRFVFI